MIEELREKVGVEKEIPLREMNDELAAEIKTKIGDKLYEAKQIEGKQERSTAVKELFKTTAEEYCGTGQADSPAESGSP